MKNKLIFTFDAQHACPCSFIYFYTYVQKMDVGGTVKKGIKKSTQIKGCFSYGFG